MRSLVRLCANEGSNQVGGLGCPPCKGAKQMQDIALLPLLYPPCHTHATTMQTHAGHVAKHRARARAVQCDSFKRSKPRHVFSVVSEEKKRRKGKKAGMA